jgi:drug/metabolite transporter (DMT)-like permease
LHGFLLALIAAALFGASTPASKWLLDAFEPLQLAGLLYLGAALGMAPAALLEPRFASAVRLDRANALRLLGAVLLGGVLGPVLLLLGLRQSEAGSVALLLNLELAATAALGALWFREHLGARGWWGAAGVVLASCVLGASGGWPGLGAAALTAAACVCWALDNHLTALIDGISAPHSTLVKGAVAGSVNLALGSAIAPLELDAGPLAAALALGALSYGVSVMLYIRAAHELGATRAQSVFASAPFVGSALAFALLGEPLGAKHALAVALLLPSIAALVRSQHGHSHAHEPLVHEHSHRHDDGHHTHAHGGLPAETRHAHRHEHEAIRHAHPHWPDLHHRHSH